MTDPVADMLTRIRNAAKARFKDVLMPNSSLKHDIARILKEEGYIKDISIVKDKGRSFIKIMLKYTRLKERDYEHKEGQQARLRRYVARMKSQGLKRARHSDTFNIPRGNRQDGARARSGRRALCTVH